VRQAVDCGLTRELSLREDRIRVNLERRTYYPVFQYLDEAVPLMTLHEQTGRTFNKKGRLTTGSN